MGREADEGWWAGGTPFAYPHFPCVSSCHDEVVDFPGTVNMAGPNDTAGIIAGAKGEAAEEAGWPPVPPLDPPIPPPCPSAESDGAEEEEAVVMGCEAVFAPPYGAVVQLLGGCTRTPAEGVTCTPGKEAAMVGSPDGAPAIAMGGGTASLHRDNAEGATPYGVGRAATGHTGIPAVPLPSTPAVVEDAVANGKTAPPSPIGYTGVIVAVGPTAETLAGGGEKKAAGVFSTVKNEGGGDAVEAMVGGGPASPPTAVAFGAVTMRDGPAAKDAVTGRAVGGQTCNG